MAKVETTIQGTKFDPANQTNSEFERLGIKPTTENVQFSLAEQADRTRAFSNVDINQYGPNNSLFSNDAQAAELLNEQRAQSQGVAEQLAKGVGHIGSTILTEVFKTPGYIGGALASPLIDGSFMENAVNNAWVNAFENMDQSLKDSMPVYLTKDVQDGSIGRKLTSSAWWATTGADGVGFLLSMYVPGQMLKALGVGSKLAKGLEGMAEFAGQESKFTKALTASTILNDTMAGAKATKKTIEGLQSASAVAINTYVESASEAANSFDNVKKSFLEKGLSEEEATDAASKAAASVFKANLGILSLSNLFDELFLFKGFGRSAEKSAKESIFGKLFTDGKLDIEAISKLKKEGIREFSKKALPKLLASGFKEGLFEEGLQTKTQQHYENVANHKTSNGFWDDVIGGYVDSLMTDPEMQESVVLGGILGGGASMVEVGNEIKHRNEFLFGKQSNYPSVIAKFLNRKEDTQAPGVMAIMKENFVNSFRTIHDIGAKNENGELIYENGKIKIDEAKFKDLIEQKQGALILNQLHNIAILEGNKAEEDMYGDQLNFNYFLPFLQQEGGYEILKQHIDSQLVDLMAKKVEDATGNQPSDEDKAGIKNKLLAKAEEFYKIYEEVDSTTNTELYVSPKGPEYGSWKQSVRDRKMQSLVAYNSANKAISDISKTFNIEEALPEDASPVDVLKYHLAKEAIGQYEKLRDSAKEKYVELSSKKGLKEDYEQYGKRLEEVRQNVEETVKEELDNTPIENIKSSDDFEKSISNAGYEVLKSPQVKGFYIKGERILVENSNGERGVIESVYNSKLGISDQYFIDKAGKSTKITDENGNIKDSFLKAGYNVIAKDQLQTERKSLAIQERKTAQLKILQDAIDTRNKQIGNAEKEIEDIEQQISEYDNQLEKVRKELSEIYNARVSSKARNIKKRQLRIQEKTLRETLTSLEDTIKNLQLRRDILYQNIPRIEAIRDEYEKLKEYINEADSFSFKQELKKVEDSLPSDKEIADIQSAIKDIESKIDYLQKVRQSIINILAANKVFIKMIMLNEKQYTKAFRSFDEFFKDVPFPYSIANIHKTITNDLKETLAGETLAKNNIITNTIEIIEWFNSNDDARFNKFGKTDPITEEDVYNKIVEILEPYVESMENLQKNSPLTLEDIHDLQSRVFITNRELDSLNKDLNEHKDLLNTKPLFRRYTVLQRLMQDRFEKRYHQIRNELAERNLDSSQKQRNSLPEPIEEPEVKDVFYGHAMSSTPFATTGISVLYEKEGQRKGKDKLDDNGFPVLNDNEFQKTWFLTVDKLSDEIHNYVLIPVHAKYDSSDDFQKAIESNFPNEGLRSNDDVFVFLADKNGKPIKVDKQSNILNSGGSFVFTSLRKVEEVFPINKDPKIAPSYILSEFMRSKGLNIPLDYNKIKDRKVSDFIGGTVARNVLKDYIDNDKTGVDLFRDAIEYNKQQYEIFIDSLKKAKGFLKIENTTRGYNLYQVGKDGKRIQHKPLSIFKTASLEQTKRGSDQLQGARLGVISKEPIMSKGQLVNLPEGTVYLKLQNEDIVTLQSRNLNKNEAQLIMYLLSKANTNVPLNTINIPLPRKKDGSSYYYQFGNHRINETLPIFARRLPNGNTFSFLNTLINYGFKSEGKNKKGEIYIQNGSIHYTGFDGEVGIVNLKELEEAIQSDQFEKYNNAVNNLFEFLLQKRFNVEKNLLTNNPIFMYPILKRHGKGDYSVQFDTSKTYYSFLLGDILTTSATTKEGYPSHLQKNVVYTPKLVSKLETKEETSKPITSNNEAKAIQSPKLDTVDEAKSKWFNEKKTNVNNARTTLLKGDENRVTIDDIFDKVIEPALENQLKDNNITLTDDEWKQLRDIFANGIVEEPIQDFDSFVNQFTKEPEKTEEEGVETPQQMLDRLMGEDVSLKPKSGIASNDADKRIDVDKLLENYIEQGIIQKNCK